MAGIMRMIMTVGVAMFMVRVVVAAIGGVRVVPIMFARDAASAFFAHSKVYIGTDLL